MYFENFIYKTQSQNDAIGLKCHAGVNIIYTYFLYFLPKIIVKFDVDAWRYDPRLNIIIFKESRTVGVGWVDTPGITPIKDNRKIGPTQQH